MIRMDNKIIRKRMNISGSVQGVGFRYRAEHAAAAVGVTGWVRNEPDDTVTMEIQGTPDQISDVLIMISRGTYVYIDKIVEKTIPLLEHEYGFSVKF